MTELASVGISVKGLKDIERLADALEDLKASEDWATKSSAQLGGQSKKTASDIDRLAGAAKAAALGLAAVFSVSSLKNYADQWSDMQSKVGSSIGDMSKAADTMQRVVDIANASYSPLSQTVDVFTRNVASFRDMGKSASAAADFTEALNHALVTTATKGQDADVVINSLSRAMAIGKLDADGFDTIVSRSPRVLQAMADKMGVATSSIRALAQQGKVTSEIISDSLIESLEKLREEAGAMPATIGDAFQQVSNNTTSLVGALDNITGASGKAAGGIMMFADGLKSLSENKQALDTIIIAGETLAVVIGSRLVTAGLASAGSFAAMQVAALRAAGGMTALATAAKTASSALVGGWLGLVVTGLGGAALAWSHYGKSARDNADEGVLGLVDAKKSVEELVAEFNKLNVLQQKQTIAIKQEELAKATKKAEEAVHDLSEAYKPFTGKGMNAVRQFNIAFQQETAALVANTEMTEAEMAQAFNDLIDGYIASGKAYADQRPKLEDMASAAVRAANDVRKLKEELFAIDVMGPPTSAMNAPSAAKPTATTGGAGKEDPGVTLIKQMQERIALIGKESEYEQLLTKIRVGSIKFATEAQKQSALAYAQTIDLLEAQAKAAEEAQKGFESNADAIANLEQQLMLAALSGKELAQAQAMLSLNEYATDEQIEKVQRLSAALFDMQERSKQKDKFGTGKDADAYILGTPSPLSGGGFDDQFARYEAEKEAEIARYAEAQERLQTARELQIETIRSYDDLEYEAAQTHAARMAQIDQAKNAAMLNSTGAFFGQMSEVLKSAGQEQTGLYKAMFLAQKAFAIADTIVNTEMGATKALGMYGPLGIPLSSMIRASGYASAGIIAGQALAGMAHDGIDSIPETGTWLLEKGERVTTADTSARLDATLARIDRQTQGGAMAANAPINIQLIEDASKAGRTEESTGDNNERVIQIFVANIRQGGEAAEALQSTFGLARQGV